MNLYIPKTGCGECADGWQCEQHEHRPWPHDECGGPGIPCKTCCPNGEPGWKP